MKLPPRPENDFAHYIDTYYEECRSRFPQIEAIAGKWMFRDLIPGMSDFDTRFLLADGMTADDWCRMSETIGKAHLELCVKYPCWARNFEHLPGVNVTCSELVAEDSYYPEYRQWTFYRSADPAKLRALLRSLENRPWDGKDEYFHLKKFCLYYGRYDRKIDPPVNLGPHAAKYPLHSRIMHYFNPPVMSAVCIAKRRNITGKFDAFEMAAALFPGLACWDMVEEVLLSRYEEPRFYEEPYLVRLEDALEEGLAAIAGSIAGTLSLVPPGARADVRLWKAALAEAPLDPRLLIFDNAKFSRLMKGRLLFYARAPSHFDASWLIRNELQRIGNGFFQVPFRTYWKLRTGEQVADARTILGRLRGNPLTDAEIAATREFARLTPGTWQEGTERETAEAIASVFDDFFRALSRISDSAGPLGQAAAYAGRLTPDRDRVS